jgi:hypothetical protein
MLQVKVVKVNIKTSRQIGQTKSPFNLEFGRQIEEDGIVGKFGDNY